MSDSGSELDNGGTEAGADHSDADTSDAAFEHCSDSSRGTDAESDIGTDSEAEGDRGQGPHAAILSGGAAAASDAGEAANAAADGSLDGALILEEGAGNRSAVPITTSLQPPGGQIPRVLPPLSLQSAASYLGKFCRGKFNIQIRLR